MKKKQELATVRARLFPSTYKWFSDMAKERRTSIAKSADDLAKANGKGERQ